MAEKPACQSAEVAAGPSGTLVHADLQSGWAWASGCSQWRLWGSGQGDETKGGHAEHSAIQEVDTRREAGSVQGARGRRRRGGRQRQLRDRHGPRCEGHPCTPVQPASQPAMCPGCSGVGEAGPSGDRGPCQSCLSSASPRRFLSRGLGLCSCCSLLNLVARKIAAPRQAHNKYLRPGTTVMRAELPGWRGRLCGRWVE